MQPRTSLRILSFLWGVAILIAALLAAYITLLAIAITLGDDPCVFGEEACDGTAQLRVVGVLFTLLGSGAVLGSLGAALSYVFYAIRPDGRVRQRANRLFLIALVCAAAFVVLFVLVGFAQDLGVDFTTDRPQ